MIVKDHKGNVYPSMSAMAAAWGVKNRTLHGRLDRGWTVEQALTTPADNFKPKHKHRKAWTDHKGNEYSSLPEMCAAYGITEKLFQGRVRNCGWDLERALTTPVSYIPGNAKAIRDPGGREFPSVSAMCKYHNVSRTLFKERLARGWDLERALCAPAKKTNDISPKPARDHKGNIYPSFNAMCRAYDTNKDRVKSRLELGWDLGRALTEGSVIYGKPIKDYVGREFATIRDAANFYGIPEQYITGSDISYISANMIASPAANAFKNKIFGGMKIIRCVRFPYFEIEAGDSKAILHFENILAAYHVSPEFDPLPASKISRVIEIISPLGFPYYMIRYGGQESVADYWTIIRLNAESGYGILKDSKEEKKCL